MGNCNFKTENETDNVAGKYQILKLQNSVEFIFIKL
jgi:hypothetical protein